MTQNQQQRFSGPELAVLLTQVRNQLGEDATIVEANRVRQGGIGGFFAKERFEVVASPAAVVGAHRASAEHLDELLGRAERVSTSERQAAGLPPRPLVGAGPEDDEAAEGAFQEILRTTLVELSEPAGAGAARDDDPTTVAPSSGPTTVAPLSGPPPVVVPAPSAPVVPPPSTSTVVPPPPTHRSSGPSGPAVAGGGGAPPPAHRPAISRPGSAFWQELARFDRLLEATPLDGRLTAVVGPVDEAVELGHLVAQWTGVEPADLVVVSERAAVDGVAPWQIVDQRDAVAERVRYWRGNGRRALVVLELQGLRDLDRVARHLAVAGADLTRLVVGDLDHPGELADVLRAIGPVAALDIAHPPDPSALLQLVENGVRVATVCGRHVTPELMAGVAASARG